MDDVRPPKPVVAFDDFTKIDLRVARVLECTDHPNADKLLILKVDLGTEQRQICADLKGHYQPADLVGKLVVVIANLEPRSMRGQSSQGMILKAKAPSGSAAGSDAAPGMTERIVVVSPLADLPPGSSVC